MRPAAVPLTLLYLTVVLRTATAYGFMTFAPTLLTRRGLTIDQASTAVFVYLFASGVGGFFGFGERLVAISWRVLQFRGPRGVMAAPLRRSDLSRARKLTAADLRALGVVRLPRRLRAMVRRDDSADAAY